MKVRHPELVLAAATAVSLPMVPGLLSGQITGAGAAERFLLALVGCWALGAMLSWVLTTYSEQSRRAQLTRLLHGDVPPGRPAVPSFDNAATGTATGTPTGTGTASAAEAD